MYLRIIKTTIDRIAAAILVLGLSPLYITLTILLQASHGSPYFKQDRPGLNGKIFRLVKFKTMNDKRDAAGKLLPDEQRLGPLGRAIRALSLDELPQLFNVLKGDMSLVGPRPLLVRYLDRYTPDQARRHEVKPGITGWAQVNGRNELTWEDKFKLDVWYVDNVSFLLDLKILFLTMVKVLKREGISNAQAATMTEFKGTKDIHKVKP